MERHHQVNERAMNIKLIGRPYVAPNMSQRVYRNSRRRSPIQGKLQHRLHHSNKFLQEIAGIKCSN